MMTKCPKCRKYAVEYDGYYQVKKCHIDGCATKVYDNGSYSFLRHDQDKIREILITENGSTQIIKEYDYPYVPYS